jgi:hypothetical protein
MRRLRSVAQVVGALPWKLKPVVVLWAHRSRLADEEPAGTRLKAAGKRVPYLLAE